MTRLYPWMLACALVGACGPKGEHGPTPVHPNSVDDPSGGERVSVEEAPRASTEQQVAPPVAEASEATTTDEAGAETDAPGPMASAAPAQAEEVTGAAEDDMEDARADAQDALQEAPASPAANPALVRQGRQVFTSTCMLCHDMGPRIAGLGWTVKRMERQIRRGGKRMSAISTDKLPNAKLHVLMAYLRTIGAVRGDELSASKVSRP